jgi:hypothetical protein
MVNGMYCLNLSEPIHLAFTVTFQGFGQIPSGFRRLAIHHTGLVLRPLVLCPTMGTKYLSEKFREPGEGGFVDLDAGVDRLSGNETGGKNLRHDPPRPPAPIVERADPRQIILWSPSNLT